MADALNVTARNFYEWAKFKLAASIVIAAGSLMLLGFCSSAAGESAANNEFKESVKDSADDHLESAYDSLAGGYGFASFLYISAFIMLVAAAFFISPVVVGSPREKKMIKSPDETDNNAYASYSDRPAVTQV